MASEPKKNNEERNGSHIGLKDVLLSSAWQWRNIPVFLFLYRLTKLPEKLLKEPTFFIEDLSLYRRSYLLSWIEKRGIERSPRMKISDLIELDSTRRGWKSIIMKARTIFSREYLRVFSHPSQRSEILQRISSSISETRFHNTAAFVNLPLAIFRDRGNAYILRQKVGGVHIEEALEQLRTSPPLKEMNQTIGVDRVLIATVNEVNKWLLKTLGPRVHRAIEDLTFFVS